MLLLIPAAFATWTILGIDPDTLEVGAAGATCGPFVWEVAGLAPGKGAVAAQYATNLAGRDLAVDRLEEGATPEAIIDELAGSFGDDDLAERQYGVVAFSGPSAGFTGELVEAEHAEAGDDLTRAQGNTLRGVDVVTLTYEAGSADLSLAERLLLGLEAGRDAGGDARCPDDAPAESAFLHVATEDDPTAYSLEVEPIFGGDPVAALRERFDKGETGCTSAPGSLPGALIAALAFARRVKRTSTADTRPSHRSR